MSTPPVSISVYTPLPYVLSYNTGERYDYTQSNGSWLYESRPSSVSVPWRNGFRACAPWWHEGGKWTKGGGYVRTGNPAPGGTQATYSGCVDQYGFPVPIMPSVNMKNRSLAECLVKLKSQDIHLGNFLAEGRRTIEMFRNTATTIATQASRFRAKHPKEWAAAKRYEGRVGRHNWCLIPNSWLQLQYGWLPLLSDLYGAIHHLKKGERQPVVVVRKNTGDEELFYQDRYLTGGVNTRALWKCEQKVNTYLAYGLENNVLAELSSLGLINPLEIIWEVTRFSFVVDWLVPVGTWLSALTAPVGFSFLGGGQSSKSTMTCVGHEFVSKGSNVLSYSVPAISGKAEHFRRTCFSSTPVPGLYVKNPISGLHIANAIALLWQSFARK
jgi:hypothetical protein